MLFPAGSCSLPDNDKNIAAPEWIIYLINASTKQHGAEAVLQESGQRFAERLKCPHGCLWAGGLIEGQPVVEHLSLLELSSTLEPHGA